MNSLPFAWWPLIQTLGQVILISGAIGLSAMIIGGALVQVYASARDMSTRVNTRQPQERSHDDLHG